MKQKHVDARGLACPKPVVLSREAILEPGTAKVFVVVDNDVSAENVQRMASSQGWEASVEKEGEEIHITLSPARDPSATTAQEPAVSRPAPAGPPKVVLLVASDRLGTGDEKLGRILMRAFIKTLGGLDPRPAKLIFANAGVRLTTGGSDLIDDLHKLEDAGVEILSCGTCLDYYGLLDSLRVGTVSNMYEIASSLLEADRLVRP